KEEQEKLAAKEAQKQAKIKEEQAKQEKLAAAEAKKIAEMDAEQERLAKQEAQRQAKIKEDKEKFDEALRRQAEEDAAASIESQRHAVRTEDYNAEYLEALFDNANSQEQDENSANLEVPWYFAVVASYNANRKESLGVFVSRQLLLDKKARENIQKNIPFFKNYPLEIIIMSRIKSSYPDSSDRELSAQRSLEIDQELAQNGIRLQNVKYIARYFFKNNKKGKK
ncbi:MAG: hypothetical protein LBN20_04325, partial [Endomicrobium sp.]|nr:hypothetical protein [Endomicrobium sp.]